MHVVYKIECFHVYNIIDDVANFVQDELQNSQTPELQSVPVSTAVMKQIGIDICNLLEING